MKVLSKYRILLSLICVGVFANMQICANAKPGPQNNFTIINNAGKKIYISVDAGGVGGNCGSRLLYNIPLEQGQSKPFYADPKCAKINIYAGDILLPATDAAAYKYDGYPIKTGLTTWTINWDAGGKRFTADIKSAL